MGRVDWQTEVSGFCTCPGEAMHTSRSGRKDCRVNVDGAPTIFCFHASCSAAVAEANRRLRSALAGGQWAIALSDGRRLRSRDILQRDGTISRKGAKTQSWEGGHHAEWGVGKAMANGKWQLADRTERMVLETLQVTAEWFLPELFDFFRWPMAEILENSPLLVAERDAEDQFRTG